MGERLVLGPNTQDVKKQLYRLYNDVNKEIYGIGVVELKITLSGDMIIFLARHNRVPVLQALEPRYLPLKQSVDHALFHEFKYRLKESLEENLDIHPLAMLKDYDPDYQMAVTVAVLEDREKS